MRLLPSEGYFSQAELEKLSGDADRIVRYLAKDVLQARRDRAQALSDLRDYMASVKVGDREPCK